VKYLGFVIAIGAATLSAGCSFRSETRTVQPAPAATVYTPAPATTVYTPAPAATVYTPAPATSTTVYTTR
jgi:hypothetical protein